MKKIQKENRRHIIQAVFTAATNGYILGFLRGTVYRGPLKSICVPGLSCYACPGAYGSCPLGALQAVLGGSTLRFPFYVVGFLLFFGALCGRVVCGFLCPFGFVQDMLHKIPFPKKIKTFRGDMALRRLKYVLLAVFVILMPLFLTDAIGQGAPYFCKLICPAGMLGGGIPLTALNQSLANMIGFLYYWKFAILAAILLLSVIIYRPFCKYLCPLGGIYAFFNKLAFYRMGINQSECIHCGKCERVCPMNVPVLTDINHAECIRCGKCKHACPTGAIKSGFCTKVVKQVQETPADAP